MNPETMTDDELRGHLLTVDGKSKEFKTRVLDEIINRAEIAGSRLAHLSILAASTHEP